MAASCSSATSRPYSGTWRRSPPPASATPPPTAPTETSERQLEVHEETSERHLEVLEETSESVRSHCGQGRFGLIVYNDYEGQKSHIKNISTQKANGK